MAMATHTLLRMLLPLTLAAVASVAEAAQLALVPVQDNSLLEDYPVHSNGAGPYIFSGATAGGSPRRALLKFDVSQLPGDAVVTAVTLAFVAERNAPSAQNSLIGLHRLLASWGEGTSSTTGGQGTQATANDATWFHRFHGTATPWNTPGGDFQGNASSAVLVSSTGTYVVPSSALLVADVESWLRSPASNHGWIMIGNESDTAARRIHSRESFSTGSRPLLTITYEPGGAGDAPLPPWAWLLLAAALLAAMHRAQWRYGRRPASGRTSS
jgi:hypothetical protein